MQALSKKITQPVQQKKIMQPLHKTYLLTYLWDSCDSSDSSDSSDGSDSSDSSDRTTLYTKKLTYLPTYLCDSSYCSDDSDSSDSSDSSEGSDSSDQKNFFFFPQTNIFSQIFTNSALWAELV